jgi:nitrite reductase (NADH) large subunit
MDVTRGELARAQAHGCTEIACLSRATGAGTVCGSCRPLLAELVAAGKPEPVAGHRGLIATAAITLLGTLAFVLLPAIPYQDTVQAEIRWDVLWRDGIVKQWTGFTLLGLAAFLSLLSLRKRLPWLRLGDFSLWRLVHVAGGVLMVIVLVAHTGLRLGDNLNGLLMASFLGLLAVGAVAGAAIGLEHALPRRLAQGLLRTTVLVHVLLLWPLPALLGFHIIKTYWF